MNTKSQPFPTELTPQQIETASLLASGKSITASADAVGVNRSTIHDWLKNAMFVAYLNGLKQDLLVSTRQKIMGLSSKALDILEGLLDDPGTDANLRVKIALRLIEGVGGLDPSKVASVGSSDPALLERQWSEAKFLDDLRFPNAMARQ